MTPRVTRWGRRLWASATLLGFLLAQPARAADSEAAGTATPENGANPAPTTAALDEPSLADFLLPVALVPVVNVVYWMPSKFLLEADYAQINVATVRGGFEHGWVFDEDSFRTNQFGHPYQGNTYFNTARTFGLSFWQSAPYVAAGSLMWEYVMESGPACCYPSINDFVTTTVGGIAVGEVLWRASNALLDDHSEGSERFFREAAVFAVNPPYGVYRLMSGDAFASGASPDTRQSFWGELSVGGSLFGSHGSAEDFAVISRARMRQGHVRELGTGIDAFDHFTTELALGVSRGEAVGATIDIAALLGGWKLELGESGMLALGPAVDFEFFENVAASLGQSAVGAMALWELPLASDWALFARGMLLGGFAAVTSDHPDIRTYNMGASGAVRLWFELRHPDWGEAYVKVDRYFVHTVSGKPSEELAGVIDAGGAIAPFANDASLGFHIVFVDKGGFYDRLADTYETIVLGEGYVAWRY